MCHECAKKKFGIVKWTLQEQEIAAILNIPAVCGIQKEFSRWLLEVNKEVCKFRICGFVVCIV
jgi:hypothetical protein